VSVFRDPDTLLRELGSERVPPEAAEVVAARRERVVEALGRGIRDVPHLREQRARRARWFSFAAAAVVALAVGFAARGFSDSGSRPTTTQVDAKGAATARSVSGTLVVTHAGRSRVVTPGEQAGIEVGDALSTAADGLARLRTDRSDVEVAPATQVKLAVASPTEERLRLAAGRVELHVERRTDSRRIVVVETPDSEVVVHGTVFSVSVDSSSGVGVTRVQVTEGTVSVLHRGERSFVTTGQDWSSAVKPQPLREAEAPARARSTETAPARPQRHGARRAAEPASGSESSSLGEENRMFSQAMEARNRGDDRAAVELFGALLGKFPGGKLAEEARIERMRALTRLGDATRAAAEARRYLARHASGFARDEARSTALSDSSTRRSSP
jgi:hypothetical protein